MWRNQESGQKHQVRIVQEKEGTWKTIDPVGMKINMPVEFSHQKTTEDQCNLALLKRQRQEISTEKEKIIVYKMLASIGIY